MAELLAGRLGSAKGSSPIEVVVGLRPVTVRLSGTRSQRIEAVKAGERDLRGLARSAGQQMVQAARGKPRAWRGPEHRASSSAGWP